MHKGAIMPDINRTRFNRSAYPTATTAGPSGAAGSPAHSRQTRRTPAGQLGQLNELRAAADRPARIRQVTVPHPQQQMPKWKPTDRYVVSSESDWVVHSGAMVQATHRKVPEANRFTLQGLSTKPYKKVFGQPIAQARFNPFEQGHATPVSQPLAGLTLSSRLDLHGHGSTTSFENLSAHDLARRLHQTGLREVGVLKLHACYNGKKHFLEDLRSHLNDLGIKVGYISGAKGALSEMRCTIKIAGKHFVINPIPFLPRKVIGSPFTPETLGLRVIKGNVDIAFPGTRYNLPEPTHAFAYKLAECTPERRMQLLQVALRDLAKPGARLRDYQQLFKGMERYKATFSKQDRRILRSIIAEIQPQCRVDIQQALGYLAQVLLVAPSRR